jgi:hypothetical protein
VRQHRVLEQVEVELAEGVGDCCGGEDRPPGTLDSILRRPRERERSCGHHHRGHQQPREGVASKLKSAERGMESQCHENHDPEEAAVAAAETAHGGSGCHSQAAGFHLISCNSLRRPEQPLPSP